MPTTTPSRTESTYPPRNQPETLRLRALSPAFTVNDIGASIKWYRDVLGFVVVDEWKHDGRLMGAAIRAGAVELILSQDDFAKGRNRKKGVGFRLHCRTVQDVDQLADAIKARGGKLAQEPATNPWGSHDFAVVDPDGFMISIGDWKE